MTGQRDYSLAEPTAELSCEMTELFVFLTWSHYGTLVVFQLTYVDLTASAFQVLGLKSCATMSS